MLGLAAVTKHIAVVDNFDSFVYILVQYLRELGAQVSVVRNDASLEDVKALNPDKILISPGPGTPANAGVSSEVISQLGKTIPIFGVCLGHQCIAEVFGATVVEATEIMHGKTSAITHTGVGVFTGLPNEVTATRYHSLTVDEQSIPEVIQITAKSDSGLVMGIRHTELDIEGVQFHPESILTEHGKEMVANFLNR